MTKRVPRHLPRMIEPVPVQSWYSKQLLKLIGLWEIAAKPRLEIILPLMVAQHEQGSGDWVQGVENLVKWVDASHHVKDIATIAAERANSWNDFQLGKVVEEAVHRPLPPLPKRKLEQTTKEFVAENVSLIRGVSDTTAASIRDTVYRLVSEGKGTEDITQALIGKKIEKGPFKKAETRVRLIAFDQLGKLTAQLNEQKQISMGVEEYVWRTLLDGRVREAHLSREGRIYRWDEPPSDGHPGEPINCRCYAEPRFGE